MQLFPTNVREFQDDVDAILPRAVKLFMINCYFNTEYKWLNREQLSEIAEKINITLTMDDVRFIEEITQDRSMDEVEKFWEKGPMDSLWSL
ncbi:hypothetical protein Bhyg_05334 [Pseudolycoriella hygida]|uniref:Uncharacterized protein n=1 Tax=Pseudolycoriella hygida TaxID=35572 RepID=A0A9Q0SAL7_9DIPT|nr:hypothetical protein Bhyg_05334 [Pseudolycoriella hygida]